MAPFFTPKPSQGNLLVLDRNSDNDESDQSDLSELEAAMHPLLKAVEAKDIKAMAQAFSDAFQIADISPHEEYPHDESEED
jgi:hypothetical protein